MSFGQNSGKEKTTSMSAGTLRKSGRTSRVLGDLFAYMKGSRFIFLLLTTSDLYFFVFSIFRISLVKAVSFCSPEFANALNFRVSPLSDIIQS